MQVETRESESIAGPKAAPTVRRGGAKRVGAVIAGAVIVATAAFGILRSDGGSDARPEPTPAPTVAANADGASVIPFPSVAPAAAEGASSVDG